MIDLIKYIYYIKLSKNESISYSIINDNQYISSIGKIKISIDCEEADNFLSKHTVNHLFKYLYCVYLFTDNIYYDLSDLLRDTDRTISAVNDVELNPVRSWDVKKFIKKYLVK